MTFNIETITLLLLVASVVSMLGRKFHLPYTVGLVLTGIVLAFVPLAHKIALTKELIFTAFLPPLIFEAAFQICWDDLRKDFSVTLTLATLGVLISTGITAVGIHLLLQWPWQTALLLGVLLAATDPVSVIATFKEAGVEGRLRLLVEAESLLNDGTAAVLFTLALTLAGGESVTLGAGLREFGVIAAGGVLCGLIIGRIALLLVGRTKDPLVEITFTTVAAYGSFLLAEHFHFSGVLATLTAGILLGNLGPQGILTERGQRAAAFFWEYIAFVTNSLIFLLIGIGLAYQNIHSIWFPAFLVTALVLLGRAAAVYGCCLLFRPTRARVTMPHQHILFWGGLRGALALALALGLPLTMEARPVLVTIAFAVVAFSVVVQGLTIPPLLRKLGECSTSPQGVSHEPATENP